MASNPKFTRITRTIFSFVAITGFVFITLLNIIFIKPTFNELLDFGSFLAAGNAARDGINPYSSDLPFVFDPGTEHVLPSPNLNPPVSVILFRMLAGLDPLQAVWGWRITTIIQFGIAVYILSRTYLRQTTLLRVLWASSLAGLWVTLALGQAYTSILILCVCAWVYAEKGWYKTAGIALGIIIAIKPNFVFWLFLLGIARQTTIFLSAASTTLTLSILPIPIFGIQIYKQWLTAISEYPSIGLLIAGNSSLQSLGAHLRFPSLGTIAAIALVGTSLYLTHRNRGTLRGINSLGIVGSLLISPFTWTGYTILCLPIFFSRPQWKWSTVMSAFIMVFPYILVMHLFNKTYVNSIVFGWFYGWGLLILFAEVIVKLSKKPQTMENLSLYNQKVNQ